jgi:predicted nuclease with TOPRIM domain
MNRFEQIKKSWELKLPSRPIVESDIDWLIEQAEKVEELTKANTKLNKEIGSYAGSVEALTEELNMLTGRMEFLKNKMLNKKQ